ncbi:MAG: cation transporter [Spirochaetales bacterium]|nr:cation transporter [Spirochaetales bacterium]
MMDAGKRTRKIKKASYAGIAGNGLLAVLQISFGTVGRSAALVGAGIDTATDILSSFITLFASDIADKPPDREHPYGHGRAETIAAKVLSFIIIFAGSQLLLSSLLSLIKREERMLPAEFVIYISIISIAAKFVLFIYKMKIGKEVNSQMVIADAKNMRADIILSSSVLVGLLVTALSGYPVIDLIMALGVSVWIIKNGFEIFMESNDELMEGSGDPELYRNVFRLLKDVDGITNPHRVRIRKINTMYVIDLDIEVDGRISVNEGHELAMQAEQIICENIENIYDIIIHIEPGGNFEGSERYGLTEDSLD